MAGKVKQIIEKSKSSPLILSFQNGIISENKKGEKRKIGISADETTALRSVKVKIGDHEFEGNEMESVTKRRTFLALRKGATGEMKMIEVSQTMPLLNSVHKVEVGRKEVGGDFQARNSALQKMFGGKKGIRRIEKSEKFRQNAATNESSLLTTVQEMEVKEEGDSIAKQISDSFASFLPPCHRDATHVDQVYLLDELLGQDLIQALSDLSSDQIDKDQLMPYTKKVVLALPTKVSNEVAIGIVMVEWLLRFVRMSMPELRKKGLTFSEFEAVHNKIIELYTVKNGNNILRPQQLRDKAVAHLIAITAALTKAVPMDILAQDTGFGKKKLVQFLRAIGCVPRERLSSIYVLKLPLPPLETKLKFR